MKPRTILAESDSTGLRVALLVERRLAAIEIDRADCPARIDSVLPARVVRRVAGVGTVVRIADGTEWLLARGADRSKPADGEPLIVQLRQAPRENKIGTATRTVSLAGRALIHLPFETGVAVSRRAALSAEQRAGLDHALATQSGGWVIRRAAALASLADISVEAAALAVEGRALQMDGLPAPDAFRRLIADHGLPAPDSIQVSGRAAVQAVLHWCDNFAPDLAPRVTRSDPGLFDAHDLDREIELLNLPHVVLPRGGSLIIEPTAALTAIDVNAGAEPNPLATNLVAAPEIARQLTLRHIGGNVVIDFVTLSRPRDRAQVVAALSGALADDPAQTHILPMSSLGLVEMTRERRGPGLP